MIRTFTVAVGLFALLTAGVAASRQAQAMEPNSYMHRTCSFQKVNPHISWTQHENELTVDCFARKMGVSVYMANLIVSHESGFNENSYNSSSCAEGLFQNICTYWPARVAAHSKVLNKFDVHDRAWNSPRAAAVVDLSIAKHSGWYSNWCQWAYYC